MARQAGSTDPQGLTGAQARRRTNAGARFSLTPEHLRAELVDRYRLTVRERDDSKSEIRRVRLTGEALGLSMAIASADLVVRSQAAGEPVTLRDTAEIVAEVAGEGAKADAEEGQG